MSNNTKPYILRQLAWLGVYTGIGLAIVFLLPSPIDYILLFGVMIAMNLLRRRWLMNKYLGRNGVRDLFGSPPSSMTGNQSRSLKYYCMGCGKEHREIACPYCGSKMKRVG